MKCLLVFSIDSYYLVPPDNVLASFPPAKWSNDLLSVNPLQTQILRASFSGRCVCLCPGLERTAPVSFSSLQEDVHLSSCHEGVGVIGGTWSCGPKEGAQPSLFPPAGGEHHLVLGSFGFNLSLSLSLWFPSFANLSLSCWVMCRHRGSSAAGWEGHNDLCILLLSRLLWCTEGELFTPFKTHINTSMQQQKTEFPSAFFHLFIPDSENSETFPGGM